MLQCLFIALLLSSASAVQNGDLRLVDGPSPNAGRVEVYYAGEWGTVCDDSWHLQDADVVCRQLGYEGADSPIVHRAGFGQGTGRIWLDQLSCTGQEQSVLECRHNGWGLHDCSHSEDAGVRCKRKAPVKPDTLPVRLNCPTYNDDGTCRQCPTKIRPDKTECLPTTAVEGIVEVFYKGVWRPVSATDWDEKDAQVLCGELGYPLASLTLPSLEDIWPNWDGSSPPSCDVGSGGLSQCNHVAFAIQENNAFRERLESTYLDAVDCTGTENKLLDCYFPSLGPSNNPSRRVATARCLLPPHRDCFSPTAEASNYKGY